MFDCPEGLEFDPRTEWCDFPERVGCSGKTKAGGETTLAQNDETTLGEVDGTTQGEFLWKNFIAKIRKVNN